MIAHALSRVDIIKIISPIISKTCFIEELYSGSHANNNHPVVFRQRKALCSVQDSSLL